MTEYEAHNKSELRTYIRLLANTPWDLLGVIGKQSWRLSFYTDNGYVIPGTTQMTMKLINLEEDWPLLREEVIDYMLTNPQYEINVYTTK